MSRLCSGRTHTHTLTHALTNAHTHTSGWDEGFRNDILEWRGIVQVVHFLLRQGLLHQQAEEDSVADLTEVLEHLGPQVSVLDK